MSGAKYYNSPNVPLEATGPVTVIDASGLVLGRMATQVVKRVLAGEQVHIVNAEKAIITGTTRVAIFAHYTFKREVGTDRTGPFFPREPHLMVKRTCRGMLHYQQAAHKAAYKRIKAHLGVPKELQGLPVTDLPGARREPRVFVTIAELATFLGRPTEA